MIRQCNPFFLGLLLTAGLMLASGGCGDSSSHGQASHDSAATQNAEGSGSDTAATRSSASGSSGSSDTDADETRSGGNASTSASVGGPDNPATLEDGVWVVHITGDDQMQYNITQFTVKAGQKVRIELEHVGQMQRAAMGHNVVVTEQGTNVMQFAMQAGSAGLDNGYLAESQMDKVIAHTEMLGGGETDSVTFTAPEQTGDYPYLCTFPAHYTQMQGTMAVE